MVICNMCAVAVVVVVVTAAKVNAQNNFEALDIHLRAAGTQPGQPACNGIVWCPLPSAAVAVAAADVLRERAQFIWCTPICQ